jgi:deoxyribonuclease-4
VEKHQRLIGAHMSIEGGFHRAVERGREAGCDVVQVFTKSNVQWASKPIKPSEVDLLKKAEAETGVRALFAHTSYLINVATPDKELFRKSIAALAEEIGRASTLGIPFLVLHCGSHSGAGIEYGTSRAAEGISEAIHHSENAGVKLLLETTAGQGTSIGSSFGQIGRIINAVGNEEIGVCLDTCHIFASGYDFTTPKKLAEVLKEADAEFGTGRIALIHANDALREAGSRIDRHEHIGKGNIGRKGFSLLLNEPELARIPVIIETRKETDRSGRDMDAVNLGVLRKLAKG